MRTSVRCAAFAAAALAVLWPGTGAHASRGFPPQIRTYLGLGYTPACSLCHQEGKTGSGTVFTPFALSTRARGLISGGGRTLVSANMSTTLSRMIADNVDSDGDGVSDIDELKAGTDPNVYGPVPMATVDPTYGCSTAPATVLVPMLLAALAFSRRRVSGSRRAPRAYLSFTPGWSDAAAEERTQKSTPRKNSEAIGMERSTAAARKPS